MMALTLPALVAIALGGALGALARFALTARLPGAPGRVPRGVLVANLLASVAAGGLLAAAELLDPVWLVGLLAGVCGSLSTFSSWTLDSVRMISGGFPRGALLNLLLNLAGALLAATLGFAAVSLARG